MEKDEKNDRGDDLLEDVDLKIVGKLDAHCWKDAKERFYNRHPTRSPSEVIKTNEKLPTSARELLDTATRAAAKFKGTRKPLARRWLSSILTQIRRHSKAIDVFAQLDPFAPAVWGVVRIVLETIADKELSTAVIVEGIHEFTVHLDRWRGIASVFSRSPLVRSDLVDLYELLLEFILTAKGYLDKHTLGMQTRALSPYLKMVVYTLADFKTRCPVGTRSHSFQSGSRSPHYERLLRTSNPNLKVSDVLRNASMTTSNTWRSSATPS
ncbi:hypothetical protein V8F20_006947 [Naviculisporaceae sp. PSN 640]